MAPRYKASRRRCSAGASSAGTWNAARSRRASHMLCSWASSCTARDDSVGAGASSTVPRGHRNSCLRPGESATAHACTRRSDSRSRRPCLPMLSSRASCSSCASALSAWASVGPTAPNATISSAPMESRLPMSRRRSTQAGLRPRRRETCRGVMPSSSSSEQTTRASSSTVVVRTGALTVSISRLCSATRAGSSTTTGTRVAPCSRHRPTRLKPSSNSKCCGLSAQGATRSGSSLPCATPGGTAPGRSRI